MGSRLTAVVSVLAIIAFCSVFQRSVTFVSAHLAKPTISSDTNDSVLFGKRIRLVCLAYHWAKMNLTITWKVPPNLRIVSKNDARIKIRPLRTTPYTYTTCCEIVSQELVVERATMANNGTYQCEVRDINNHQNYENFTLQVLKPSSDYVFLREEKNRDNINVRRNVNGITPPIDIVIEYTSYPSNITYYWVNDAGSKLPTGHHGKYELSHTDNHVKLRIKDPTVYDTGSYTLFVKAGKAQKTLRIGVNVFAKPTVQMESKFVKPNEKVSFTCRSIGYPRPYISFAFVPCLSKPWTNCSMPTSAILEWDTPGGTGETLIATVHTYDINATQPGVVHCRATNVGGSEVTQADLLISDLPDAITFVKERPKETIFVGDHVTLVCSALVYNYTNDITFIHNNKELQASDGVSKDYSPQLYAWQARLDINHVKKDHKGPVYCLVKTIVNTMEIRIFDMEVLDSVAPRLLSGKSIETLSVDLYDPLKLECDVIGTPNPKIVWLKDSKPVQLEKNSNRVQLTKNTLFFEYLKKDDLGMFKCRAENRMGTIEKYWKVDVRSAVVRKSTIYIILGVLVGLIVGMILLIYFFCKKMKGVKTIKEKGSVNVKEGNLGHYNLGLVLDEQAGLLPYNSEFEFPKERLKLGKQLGTGAFGVVTKATATRIMGHEDETTVAVKMVKKTTDNEVMRALVLELKILVHLGQHLNVVNLLGAVTKNITERELMVIVEYCRFGNVQNFLIKHRPYFIDQINQETGEIHSSVDNNPAKFDNQNKSGSTQCVDQKKHLNSNKYDRHPDTEETAMTPVEVKDLHTLNSNEPLWRSTYGMDYKGPARSVNTTDLVCWASQIASGMEYLASRKVLHGDLAARNILLCDDNVVKICDFGLARSMYNSENYKKNGETPLPFKWLALECFSDNLFGTYSDVWAYGIVLWELFSLGKVPYPGMEANQELYNKLRDGYRMDNPEYSNQEIYDIMLNCWYVKPDSRPSFKDLKSRFNAMLPAEMRDHYLELNEPYLRMNAKRMERGDIDYLANLGPPEEPAPAAPNYVNGLIVHLPPSPNSLSSPNSLPSPYSPPNGSKRHDTRSLPIEILMLEDNC